MIFALNAMIESYMDLRVKGVLLKIYVLNVLGESLNRGGHK